METMECQNCGVINPDTAERCDCGYAFVSEGDLAQAEVLLEELRAEQNMPGAVLAGLIAAGLGAYLWSVITIATGYQIGFMAIGVGVLVGGAVRGFGKGIEPVFGVIGATLALLGCAAGNLLTVSTQLAQAEGMAVMDVLSLLDIALAWELLTTTSDPLDFLFYGIAIYEGYKLSFTKLRRS